MIAAVGPPALFEVDWGHQSVGLAAGQWFPRARHGLSQVWSLPSLSCGATVLDLGKAWRKTSSVLQQCYRVLPQGGLGPPKSRGCGSADLS